MTTSGINIHLHIERLILDGLELSQSQEAVFQTALEAEMVRLLGETGLHQFSQNQSFREISGGTIQMTPQSHPALLGQQIAQAVVEVSDSKEKRRIS